MGLTAFARTTSRLNRAVENGQVVLVSPFTPNTPFQEKLADARNLLIDYLALALLILYTDETAQARATAALDRGVPVFVGLTDTAAHRTLIDQGALLLTDAGEVVEMVQQAIIDAALQEPADEPVSPSPAPVLPTVSNSTDDYALRVEDVEPIDSEEALEILSLGGEIPEVLRQRLQPPEDDD
jgi:predicted Rossmann fold nucleotide-binding protein DprA/Smf involved in DNA uptake